MKVLDIFMTLLIAGIWSPAISQTLSPNTDEVIRGIYRFSTNIDALNTDEGLLKIERLDGLIREKCEENSGPAGNDNLVKAIQDFQSCMRSHFDLQQMQVEASEIQRTGNAKPFFKKYCPKLPILTECGDPVSDSIKACLEPDERNVFNDTRSTVDSILEFMCQDGGDKLGSFANFRGGACLKSQESGLQACVAHLGDPLPGNPTKVIIPNLANLSSLDLSSKDCSVIETFRTCTVGLLRDCNNPEAENVWDSMVSSFKRSRSCQNTHTWINSTSIGEQVSSVTELDEFKSFLRRKCEKNAGPAAYDTALENMQFVWNSTQLLINPPQFKAEISTVHSMEGLHNVFKKYCRRAPILNELDIYYFDSIKPCLELEERRSVDVVHNVSSATLDFFCYNGGDRIATFIADGDMECLVAKGEAILNCATQNFGSYIRAFGSLIKGSSDALPVLGSEFCTELNRFRYCSVEVLAECADQSSANLVASLLTSISNGIPCVNGPVAHTFAATELDERSDILSESGLDIEIITGLADLESMNVTNEDVEIYLRKKCERNGGPTAYETARKIPEYLSDWHESVMEEMKQLAMDIREAQLFRPNRKLNVVFTKYCRKVPTIKRRMRYVAESIKSCLDSVDRIKVDTPLTATSLILEFACQNKANNIAKFFATGGGKCLLQQKKEIASCFKENQFSKSRHLAISNPTVDSCTYYLTDIQRCIVNEMKKCADTTPAAIVDSMLNSVNGEFCNRLVA